MHYNRLQSIIFYWTLNVCVHACFTNCGASFPSSSLSSSPSPLLRFLFLSPFPSPPLPLLLSPLLHSLSFFPLFSPPLSFSFSSPSPFPFPLSLLFPPLSPSPSLSFPPPPTSFLLPQVEQLAEEIQSLQQQLRSCLKDRTQVKTLQLIPGGQCLVYHIVLGKCPYPPTPQF